MAAGRVFSLDDDEKPTTAPLQIAAPSSAEKKRESKIDPDDILTSITPEESAAAQAKLLDKTIQNTHEFKDLFRAAMLRDDTATMALLYKAGVTPDLQHELSYATRNEVLPVRAVLLLIQLGAKSTIADFARTLHKTKISSSALLPALIKKLREVNKEVFTSEWFEWAFDGNLEMLKQIRQSRNQKDELGKTPLFYACIGGHLSAVKLLCNIHQHYGEHLNFLDKQKGLIFAVIHDHFDIVKMLIETYQAPTDTTPSLLAYAKSERMMNYLFDQNVKITDDALIVLLERTLCSDPTPNLKPLELFLSRLNPETRHTVLNFGSPKAPPAFQLYMSAANVSLAFADTLLQYGANVDTLNSRKHTSLHNAVESNSIERTQFLLERKANVNAVDSSLDRTPLCYANSTTVAELLLKYGAKIEGLKDNRTVFHFARNAGIVKLLKQRGANFNPRVNPPLLFQLTIWSTECISDDLLEALVKYSIVDQEFMVTLFNLDRQHRASKNGYRLMFLQSLATGHFDAMSPYIMKSFLTLLHLTPDLVLAINAEVGKDNSNADALFLRAIKSHQDDNGMLAFLAEIYLIKATRKGFVRDAHINAIAIKEAKPIEPDFKSMRYYLDIALQLSARMQPAEHHSFCLSIAARINKMLAEDVSTGKLTLKKLQQQAAEKIKYLHPLLQKITECLPINMDELSAEEHLTYANLLRIILIKHEGKPIPPEAQQSFALDHAKRAVAKAKAENTKAEAVELVRVLELFLKDAMEKLKLEQAPRTQLAATVATVPNNQGDSKACDHRTSGLGKN